MGRSNQRTNQFSDFKPIRPRRAFEGIILQIEQAVTDGRLLVGDRLPPERELAGLFKVSRSSVREGLRILEALGILRARRGTGAESGSIVGPGTNGLASLLRVYASLQRIPLWDLVEIREAMEMFTAHSAAERASSEQAGQVVAAAEQMVAVQKRELFLQLDTEFHLLIARVSNNALAPLFMEAIREAMAREMRRAFLIVKDWAAEREMLTREHLDIAMKIQSRRGEAAAHAMSEHIRGFYGRVLQVAVEGEPGPSEPDRTGLASIKVR